MGIRPHSLYAVIKLIQLYIIFMRLVLERY